MFGPKPKPGSLLREGHAATPEPTTAASPTPPRVPPAALPPELRRPQPSLAPTTKPDVEVEAAAVHAEPEPETAPDQKRLIVGRGIVLKGEITSCDRLVVEGTVEASVSDTDTVLIAETGHFNGDAEVNEADVSGVFEGNLKVRGRLIVRGTGRIHGEVRYAELEVEHGGRLSGDVQIAGEPRAVEDIAEEKTASAG